MSKSGASLPVRRGLVSLILAGATWGTTGVAVDLVYRSSDLGPLAVSFWRYASGLALLLAVRATTSPRSGDGSNRGRPRVLVRAATGLGLALFQTAYFGAVEVTGVAVATIVTLGAAPVLTAIGGRWALRERLGRAGFAAVAAAFCGLAVLVLGNHGGTVRAFGVALALLSAAGFALTTLTARGTGRAGDAEDPVVTTAWAFGIGAAVMLPLAAAEGLLPHTAHVARVLVLFVYVAAVPTAIAYPLYFAGAAVVRAATASIVMLIEPVIATVIAIALLGERVVAPTLLGTVLLLSAVAGLATAESRECAVTAASPTPRCDSGSHS
jgi:DME family drug/metabolite transporter